MQIIECDGCGYRGQVHLSNAVYATLDLKYGLPVYAQIGWCFNCHQTVAVEEILDVGCLRRELAEAIESRGVVPSQTDDPQFEVAWANARVRWRLGRMSPARCLLCGSINIRNLGGNLGRRFATEAAEHPGCSSGGTLRLAGCGYANYEGWNVYTPEGLPHCCDDDG